MTVGGCPIVSRSWRRGEAGNSRNQLQNAINVGMLRLGHNASTILSGGRLIDEWSMFLPNSLSCLLSRSFFCIVDVFI
jgi:hypothetical protein